MKNKKILFLISFLFLSFNYVNAAENCSKNGYTILTINGMFTDETGAFLNKNALKYKLSNTYKNEPVNVDYIYNPTHLAGAGDLVDVVKQGLFDEKSDYDLTELLNSASEKVKTQKLLLVGHSQGNFYANNFYKKIVNKEGGVPANSLGVYGVATPASSVAGGGKYLTSDTDRVISTAVGRVKNIMSPNTHINLQKSDGNGHSFSDVYLKYRGTKIVSDIKSSLDKLKTNNIQPANESCISEQKVSVLHKINKAIVSVADTITNNSFKTITTIFNKVNNTAHSLASNILGVAKKNLAIVGLAENESSKIEASDILQSDQSNTIENNIPTAEETTPIDSVNTEEIKTDIVNNSSDENNSEISTDSNVSVSSGGGGGGSSSSNSSSSNSDVVIDNVPPVITLNGDENISIKLNDVYTDASAIALDDKDGAVLVSISGVVDNTKIGTYIITYTATDKALNSSTKNRTVNVISDTPISSGSGTSFLSFPDLDNFRKAGVFPMRGRVNIVDYLFNVTYTNSDNVAPESIKIHLRNKLTNIYLPDIEMTKYDSYKTPMETLGDGDFRNGETYTAHQLINQVGDFIPSYTAYGKDGIIAEIKEKDDGVISNFFYEYVYVPRNTFGTNNGDGNDWQIWAFDGSNVYDWSDVYVNKYLKESFTVQAYNSNEQYWCVSCLEKGIFNLDPRGGFNDENLTQIALEHNIQNLKNDNIYNIVNQWDSTGYTYTISHNSIIDYTGHVDVPNINENTWVGWTTTNNNFKKLPTDSVWVEHIPYLNDNRSGGFGMVTIPYRVYDPSSSIDTPVTPPVVEPEVPKLSSEKLIKSFKIINTDPVSVGVIDNVNYTVKVTVPYGTNLSETIPEATVSDKAIFFPPNSGRPNHFYDPVEYNVIAEDQSIQKYIVTVTIAPPVVDPNVNNDPPSIKSYKLSGVQDNVVINPIINNLHIILIANKNVNWMSIQIEKEDDDKFYKTYQSNSDTCIDGSNICERIWSGELIRDIPLQNGVYRVKVHIKDESSNEYNEYLDSKITVFGQ